jgi:hypothetical protein
MESLRENTEKAMKSPRGSSVANRALELLDTQFGLFRIAAPPAPTSLDGLTLEQLEQLIDNMFGTGTVASVRGEEERN